MGGDGILDASNGAGAAIGGRRGGKLRQQLDDTGWENVPPYRQLRVLLVEDDDSTRHVVAALLRNCGYEVVSASNGLQAWSLLDNHNHNRHIDLVLTDVVMPGLSGIGLLSKMMHHDKHKKIPVVMMSSHDATHVVFKCLSKGAADFLVKPVRKNELKNLWQHAWRRSQSSSVSESETGRVNRDGGSSDGIDSESGCVEIRGPDQSDNGSAQSSCTKKAEELEDLESPRKLSKSKRGRRIEDSNAADDLGARSSKAEAAAETPDRDAVNLVRMEAVELAESKAEAFESEAGASNSPEVRRERDATSSDLVSSPGKVDPSLKSPTYPNHGLEANHILHQSGPSAFTRYNTRQPRVDQQQDQHPQQQQQVFGSAVQLPGQNYGRAETGATPAGRANDSAAVAAATAAAAAAAYFTRPGHQQHAVVHPVQYAAFLPGRGGAAAYYYAQPALPPWQHAFSPQQEHSKLEKQQQQQQQYSELEKQTQQQQERQENFQAFTNILAHHHHYHIEHHHHGSRGGGGSGGGGGSNLETPGCGSTNVAGNGDLNTISINNNNVSRSSYGNNGSVSGSNHGSNNYDAATARLSNFGSGGDSNPGLNSCSVPVDSNNNNNNMDINSNMDNMMINNSSDNSRIRREAALNKFRQKRKERCFEKKVRYQSRKRLAEQRPRVRGQFVSQAVYDSSITDLPAGVS